MFDPEGDYDELEHAMTVGDAKNPPNVDEVVAFLRKRVINLVVNTQALSADERPSFFARLLPEVSSLRARTGRPHWLIIDEAHHLLAAPREDIAQVIPERLTAVIFVTVHPDTLSSVALQGVEIVLAVGDAAARRSRSSVAPSASRRRPTCRCPEATKSCTGCATPARSRAP